jgi:periplasmic protein TonB
MIITEKGTERLSFLITVLIHILLLLIPLSLKTTVIPDVPEYTKVPVNFELKEKPKPKPIAKKGRPKTSKGKTKAAGAGAPKKTGDPHPGDRKHPIVASSSLPSYPKDAINNDWEGTVKVKAKVNAKGRVIYATIIKSSGHKILDESFLRTVKEQYQFKPKREYGKNETGFITIKYTFEL